MRILSDIKQITVKKSSSKKVPIITKNPDGTRKNILQRNVARSTGARSGSNKGGKQSLIAESPILPLKVGAQQRNNSSNPNKDGHNSNNSILVDEHGDGGKVQTPKQNVNTNAKIRTTNQLNNSATRVPTMRTGLSLEGKNMLLPPNNFVHQS